MTLKKKKKTNKDRIFDRAVFEREVGREAKTVSDILEMHKKGLIGEHDYLFPLNAIKTISMVAYKGGWNDRILQNDPFSRWSRDTGARNANDFIRDAFV